MQDYNRLLKDKYNIITSSIVPISMGAGGDNYFVNTASEKYVLKIVEDDQMNHPQEEPYICYYLRQKRIPVAEFIKTNNGDYSFNLNNKIVHLQRYIEGFTPKLNEMSDECVLEALKYLALIHRALDDYKLLPKGLGEDFFIHMTPDNARKSYLASLEQAKNNNELDIVDDIEFRISFLDRLADIKINPNKLTYKNSHGDYTSNQIIINEGLISGIIDFTSASCQPVVWEFTRFFYHADCSAQKGVLDRTKFKYYLAKFLDIEKLNEYDLENILKVYYYQLAVCNYYSQYYSATGIKKRDYLKQAKFATNILRNVTSFNL